jgi:phosphoribosylanthranilate isomerase
VIIKVCGVRTAEVADAAVAAGADWIGLVFEPRSPRHASDANADAVREATAGRAALVGVLVAPALEHAQALVRRHRLDALQLHGDVPRECLSAFPVPVIRGLNMQTLDEVVALEWPSDCLLLVDAPPLSPQALPGGTGRRLDLELAAAVSAHRDIVLAGGLDHTNVDEAVRRVRPAGVDASSGLESALGIKDSARVCAYVEAARRAERDLAAWQTKLPAHNHAVASR